MGPVAPVLPQLPQVSQLVVSSTLSSTVVPGVGLATGVGLGVGVGLAVGDGAGVGVGVEVGTLPDTDEPLLPAERLPPQELMSVDAQKIAKTQAATA